jgi:hypothetical protein
MLAIDEILGSLQMPFAGNSMIRMQADGTFTVLSPIFPKTKPQSRALSTARELS